MAFKKYTTPGIFFYFLDPLEAKSKSGGGGGVEDVTTHG